MNTLKHISKKQISTTIALTAIAAIIICTIATGFGDCMADTITSINSTGFDACGVETPKTIAGLCCMKVVLACVSVIAFIIAI